MESYTLCLYARRHNIFKMVIFPRSICKSDNIQMSQQIFWYKEDNTKTYMEITRNYNNKKIFFSEKEQIGGFILSHFKA